MPGLAVAHHHWLEGLVQSRAKPISRERILRINQTCGGSETGAERTLTRWEPAMMDAALSLITDTSGRRGMSSALAPVARSLPDLRMGLFSRLVTFLA
jgi:hypothetical protein